ncbi:MAG: UMP kinase, partial [Prolixibacteraceae bacterium]|nr:UMP kinase [Prolixibacteraceae bacterium]
DGIYTADPEKYPDARKFDQISYDEVYKLNLKVMDLTAITLCKENNLPVLVFNMNKKGSLKSVLNGASIGTLVK